MAAAARRRSAPPILEGEKERRQSEIREIQGFFASGGRSAVRDSPVADGKATRPPSPRIPGRGSVSRLPRPLRDLGCARCSRAPGVLGDRGGSQLDLRLHRVRGHDARILRTRVAPVGRSGSCEPRLRDSGHRGGVGVVAAYMGYRPSGFAEVFTLYTQVAVLQLMIGALVFYLIERSHRQRKAELASSSIGRGRERAKFGSEASGVIGTDRFSGESSAFEPAAALLARLPAPKRASFNTCACRTTTSKCIPTRAWKWCCCASATHSARLRESKGCRCTGRIGWPRPQSKEWSVATVESACAS